MIETLLFGFAFVATTAGISVFKRSVKNPKLLDIPNERSSHEKPTLRGAGVVVVLVCLASYIVLSVFLGDGPNWGFLGGALLIAAVSWVDDLVSLPAALRLVVHGAAAMIVTAYSGPIPSAVVPGLGGPIELGWAAFPLTVVWLVWMINAYNFMDGIDGIAGAQAVVAGVGWTALAIMTGMPLIYFFGGVLAFSALGFLMHNWSPASVFMGDVGSAFFGFAFASMPVIAGPGERTGREWLFPAAVCILWPFLFDTIYTFIRRLYRGEKFWQAHRQHLYQRLVISGSSHPTVSLIYACFSLLCTCAFLAAMRSTSAFAFVVPVSFSVAAITLTLLAHRKNI